jgi:hypothetical protein
MATIDNFEEPIGLEEAQLAIQLRNHMAYTAMASRGLPAEEAEMEANVRLWVVALRASLEHTGMARADLIGSEAEAMLKELAGE